MTEIDLLHPGDSRAALTKALGDLVIPELGACYPEMFGAVGDGVADDQRALQATAADAAKTGRPIALKAGATYAHSGVWELNGVAVYAPMGGATLLATDARSYHPQHAIRLTGDNPQLVGVNVTTTWTGSRQDNPQSAGVVIEKATNYVVRNCRVSKSASVGIFTRLASIRGNIVSNFVSDTLADGIHTVDASRHILVSMNTVWDTGDDCISVVSYVPNGPPVDSVQIALNQVSGGAARGIAVVGGTNVAINHNQVFGARMTGIYVVSEDSYQTHAVDQASVDQNLIVDCARDDEWKALNVQGRVGYPIFRPRITNNVVRFSGSKKTSYFGAIIVWRDVVEADVQGNQVINSPGRGFTFNCRGLTASGNNVDGAALDGIHIDADSAGIVRISNNRLNGCNNHGIASEPLELSADKGACNGLIIDGNDIATLHNPGNPIDIQAGGKRLHVRNNTLDGLEL